MKNLLYVAAILISGVAFAQEKSDVATPQNDKVHTIQLANNLAKYGYDNASALALIQAAQMLSTVPVADLEADPKTEEQGKASSDTKTSQEKDFTVEQLIADAKEMAAGDATLLALAKTVKAPAATRGTISGPYSISDNVNANTTDVYRIKFWADSTAEILVIGDGDTDLDLYVYDENGNLIEKDIDSTDDCYVKWTPRWTGVFVVKIKNLGSVYNHYSLYTN